MKQITEEQRQSAASEYADDRRGTDGIKLKRTKLSDLHLIRHTINEEKYAKELAEMTYHREINSTHTRLGVMVFRDGQLVADYTKTPR